MPGAEAAYDRIHHKTVAAPDPGVADCRHYRFHADSPDSGRSDDRPVGAGCNPRTARGAPGSIGSQRTFAGAVPELDYGCRAAGLWRLPVPEDAGDGSAVRPRPANGTAHPVFALAGDPCLL